MKDFWEKLDEAFAHIFKTKGKQNEDPTKGRRLPRKDEGTRK